MATSGKDLTERERERLRKLREAGLSIRAIAERERVSKTTVGKYVKPSA